MNEQPTQLGTAQLDPQIVNLTKAIRQTESGGNFQAKGKSGEYGAYQFTEPTWNAQAKKYGVNVPLTKATPEQQNEVAYKQIAEWKAQGHNVGQIASMWNAGVGEPDAYTGKFSNGKPSVGVNKFGVKYSVPDYAKSVATAYQKLKMGGQVGIDPNNPSSIEGTQMAPEPNPSGTWYPSSSTDTPIEAGAKTLGNLIPSAINFGKGILDVFNPISTVRKLGELPGAIKETVDATGGIRNAIEQTASALPGETYKAVVPEAGRQLIKGDFAGAQKSITNDPVGQIAPFLLGAEGLAKGVDSITGKTDLTGALDKGISKTAKVVTKPLSLVTDSVSNLASGITKSAASHLTGLDSQTITQILSNPEAFSKLEQDQISRGGLASEFGNAVDNLEGTLQETGKAYEPIRTLQGVAAVPENFIPVVLDKFGLKIEDGRLTADTNSVTRNSSDINAIQKFIDDWGNKTELTPNEFLNMRSDLAELANYDKLTGMGKTKSSQMIADQLRQEANRTIRPQIPSLKDLDAEYAPLRQQFEQVKRDFLKKTPDGYEFKDGAINKIANAAGVGKDALLSRMEDLMPGITKRIQILKAVEDIERAKGIKVGNYARGVIGGFALTGNMAAIVGAIISNPSIAIPLIRGLGWGTSKITPVLHTLKMIAGDLSNKAIESPYTKPTVSVGVTENNQVKK